MDELVGLLASLLTSFIKIRQTRYPRSVISVKHCRTSNFPGVLSLAAVSEPGNVAVVRDMLQNSCPSAFPSHAGTQWGPLLSLSTGVIVDHVFQSAYRYLAIR